MTNPQALRKLTRARAALVVTQPFWGVLALNLRPVERTDVDTMGTDGESLVYSPDFVLSLSDPELRGVIAHEVEHVARLHHTRRGHRRPDAWNEAADYAINQGLLDGGFKLPAGGLVDPMFRNMSAEAIYSARAASEAKDKERQQQQGQQKATGGQGQGSGQGQPQPGQGQPKPAKSKGGFGQIMDAPGGEAGRAAAEAKAQQNTRQAAMVAKAQGAGKLPGFISEIIAEMDKPRVDWRAVLRRFADELTLRETCWTKPNRGFAGSDFILPGHESVAPSHIVAIVNTSGSMDARALAAIGGELQGMLDESACEKISVVYADTKVQRVRDLRRGRHPQA